MEVLGRFLDSNLQMRTMIQGDAFLGCYLGPHVRETLFDRKARLYNQLALSRHPCATLLLHNLYVIDKDGSNGSTTTLEDVDGEES